MSDANWCRVNGLGSDVSSANTHRKKNRSRMFYFCIWLLFSSFVFRTVIRIDSRFICIFTIRRSNCETESKKLEYLQQRERDECWWIEGKWKKNSRTSWNSIKGKWCVDICQWWCTASGAKIELKKIVTRIIIKHFGGMNSKEIEKRMIKTIHMRIQQAIGTMGETVAFV